MSLKILTYLILVINYVYGKQERIIGGSFAHRYDFPYQAILRRISDNVIICGGAIISHYHIITAAHCVDERSIPHTNLKINLGGFNQTHEFISEYLPYQIIIHPSFTGSYTENIARNHDIAVIRTRQDIYFDVYQNRVLLPDKDIVHGEIGVLSGWGTVTQPRITVPNRLQKVNMIVMEPTTCQMNVPILIYGDQFCGYISKDVGPCIGDGGNPLVKDNKIIGLFSISILCAQGVPDVYTNVYAHLMFIRSAMAF